MGLFNWFKKGKKDKEEINQNQIDENINIQENNENDFENNNNVADISDIDYTQENEITEDNKDNKEEIQEQVELKTEDNITQEQKTEVDAEIQKVTPVQESKVDDVSEMTKDELLDELEQAKAEVQEILEENVIDEIEKEIDEEEKQEQEEKPKKLGFFAKIKNGLAKTRNNIMSGVEQVLKSFTTIDEELYEELEEALIMADLGVDTSLEIISKVRELVKKEKVHEVNEVKGLIVRVITEMLEDGANELELPKPSVILVIGVNGVGKTTTIGKLTNNYKNEGKSVLLAAADTFRAAAIDQLEVWGERNGVDVIKHEENSDPAAVVFDAVKEAKARNTDILICDTAGRLHNKKNLMEELRKIAKIINREYSEAHVEVFLVLDATTGQNALQQAKLFNEVADITGIVLTKLDGTAKGGIVISIKNELNIPVRYIGVGEGLDDLQSFNAGDFAKALFDTEEEND